jgi:3-methyladenine DNA glycosylase AlkD
MEFSTEAYVDDLCSRMAAKADPVKAEKMAAYMRNQFSFFGISSPMRREITSRFLSERGLPPVENLADVCQACWNVPQRELQYVVNDLGRKLIKKAEVHFLDRVESLILQKSWWDTVDFLAPKLAGRLFLRFPATIPTTTERWIESDNIWLQRSAILFQLDYKDKTDADLLYRYILRRKDSKEFFVRKGAGWALRQYSKTHPESVRQFIESHPLSGLTVLEGMKWIRKKG